ncbi:hypothetical protein MUA02_03310 [Enterobacteriaceae bacterium H20N1]|uniref:hypothetical protein n=1 Tax=Dryocola boscaweniae TaxID=2925397 RepID=UPI0022F0F2BD|nr:hypothetical protein [Dryocola boscaweniae]MCT4718074.1 hypothetical protein [Dryocola boscaweniae]
MTALGAAATAFLTQLSYSAEGNVEPSFRAGAGKAWVTFEGMNWPVDGFSGQHDLLGVRALLLEHARTRFCFVVVELTSLSDEMIDDMKVLIQEKTHAPVENILVCASHTFSAPHVFPSAHIPPGTSKVQNQDMLNRFKNALLTAVTQATDHLQPARIGFGSGSCQVNISRDQPGEKGWWLGINADGFADPFVGVVRIDNQQGQPLAVLFNYAVQSSVTEDFQPTSEGKKISADLAGSTARYIEEHAAADMVALFLVGAAGDQAPIFQAMQTVVNDNGSASRISNHVDAFELLHQLATRLGREVMKVLDTITTSTPTRLQMVRDQIPVPALNFSPENAPKGPVTTFRYQPAGNIKVPVTLMQMGNIIWIGLQPELSAITATYIREHSPFQHTFVSTMVNGSAKYMPDAQSYDRFTYEARSSPFARGAAEFVATAIIKQLEILHANA